MQKRAKQARRYNLVLMCCIVILAALLVGSWSFTLQVKVAHERSMSTFALNTERVETDNVSLAGCSFILAVEFS